GVVEPHRQDRIEEDAVEQAVYAVGPEGRWITAQVVSEVFDDCARWESTGWNVGLQRSGVQNQIDIVTRPIVLGREVLIADDGESNRTSLVATARDERQFRNRECTGPALTIDSGEIVLLNL